MLETTISSLTILFLCSLTTCSELQYPRTVFTYFDRENAPGIQEILDFNRQSLGDEWKMIFLTATNVSSFLNLSQFPAIFKSMHPTHQSDYLRLRLIEQYGGWWIDASTLISNRNYLAEVVKELEAQKGHFLGYCVNQCPTKQIGSSVFYAPTGSVVMRMWRRELERSIHVGAKKYISDAYTSGVTLPKVTWQPYPNISSYYIIHITLQVALQRSVPRSTPIRIYPGKEHTLKLYDDCSWNDECMKKRFLEEFSMKRYNISKLNGGTRKHIYPDTNSRQWHATPFGAWNPGANVSEQTHAACKIWLKAFAGFHHIVRFSVIYGIYGITHIFHKQLKRNWTV